MRFILNIKRGGYMRIPKGDKKFSKPYKQFFFNKTLLLQKKSITLRFQNGN